MTSLADRLVAHIEREGPITFAEFMSVALYDPDDGFYSLPPVGPGGDFVTSPHVSSGFGAMLARQIGGMWRALGRPSPYVVTEVGAGDGTLARSILAALAENDRECAASTTYRGVEISAGARTSLAEAGIDAAVALTDFEPAREGCVLAHELLDNLPFHRLRAADGALVEVRVGARDGRLVEQGYPPCEDALGALRAPMRDGEERPVSPAALRFVHAASAMLERGHVLVWDYGFVEGEDAQPVRAYEGHRVHDRVLERPGSADITAGVDFSALVAEARAIGARVWGPATQRDVLRALGFTRWLDDLRKRRLQAEASGASREVLRLVAEQSRAPLLVDPAHLGAHRVLAIGVGDVDAPPGLEERA